MKQLSKEEIEKKVAETFKGFPHTKKLYATLDGNVFIEENRAKLHATIKGTVLEFDRPIEASEENEPIKMSAQEVIKLILEAQTLEDLAKYATDERKTVKAAFEKRSEELEADVDQDDEEVEVTQELLDANPDLVDLGVALGEKIKIPKV